MAEKRFERGDFNVLYDYLWRDKALAQSEQKHGSPLYGKNKAIRQAAAERERMIDHIISIMDIIEKDNLVFKNGKIIKKGEDADV